MRPAAENTLENPIRLGAEGARLMPNLSGKGTERIFSVFLRKEYLYTLFFRAALWAAFFIFGGI